jgi:tellurite resistance protein
MEPWIPALGGALLGVLLLWAMIRCLRKKRLLENLPTSKAQGVFIGLVELKGVARAEQPLVSYLAEVPCVWYSWNISERWSRWETQTYTDSKGRTHTRLVRRSGWTTVASGGYMIPFYLVDDTGAVLVRPDGAQVEPRRVFSRQCGPGDPLYYGKGPAGAIPDSDHVRAFTESAIPLEQPIYVVGRAREREDVVAPEIAYDRRAEMFLISCRTEAQVTRGYAWAAWACGLVGVLCAGGGAYAAGVEEERPLPWLVAAAVAAWLLLAALAWVWMVYNELVNLRERVRQARSLVDVELKRRRDLIPRLVEVVKGLRDHEARVQEQVARLRAQAAREAGSPEGCTASVRAIAEAYPELKSNEAFLSLQSELTRTEQRIALARAYLNDIVTHYNNRLEVVPDNFVARLLGLKREPLFEAQGFERAVVQVSFGDASRARRAPDTLETLAEAAPEEDRRAAYAAAVRMARADQSVAPEEEKVLARLREVLKIRQEDEDALKAEGHRVRRPRTQEGRALLVRCAREVAQADGVVRPQEEELLRKLEGALAAGDPEEEIGRLAQQREEKNGSVRWSGERRTRAGLAG